MTFDRVTLARDVSMEGLGLHSGDPVTVTLRPSEEGIVFRHGSQTWRAEPANVTDTTRCTRLGEISTVEHLMSALAGLEITDVDVEVTALELPAADGCAAPYVAILASAGRTSLGPATLRDPFSRVFVQEPEAKIAIAHGTGHWKYEFETGDRWPGHQAAEFPDLPTGYAEGIALARTFGFEEEIPHLHKMGLAKGLDLTSALVLGRTGPINDMRCPDEPARHKLLDTIGDLYLAGVPIRFLNVAAFRTGHRANVQAARQLYEAVQGTAI